MHNSAIGVFLSPEEIPTAEGVILGVSVHDIQTQPFGSQALSLGVSRLCTYGSNSIFLLQASQRQSSVDWLKDNRSDNLRYRLTVAYVVSHQCRDAVKSLLLKQVLNTRVGLVHGYQAFVDFEVLRGVLPLAGQNVVSRAGQRVSDQKVSISLNQVFSHLNFKTYTQFLLFL